MSDTDDDALVDEAVLTMASDRVRLELLKVYTPEGTKIWLHARNKTLGERRPIDLIAEGRVDEVLDAVRQLTGERS